MGDKTGIAWTQRTWNPFQGCHKISAGCKHCYMYRDKARYGQDPNTVVRSAPATFNAPLRAGKHAWNPGDLVFTASWSDWGLEEVDAYRNDAWDVIRRTPHLTYQILTKRADRLPAILPPDWGDGYPNVWLGVSVENADAMWRAKALAEVPARLRFLSVEPLLGPVASELAEVIRRPSPGRVWGDCLCAEIDPTDRPCVVCSERGGIGWVILGGESGNGAETCRPCSGEWIRDAANLCIARGVPVFVKQLGGRYYDEQHGVIGKHTRAEEMEIPFGYRRLADSHGGDPTEWPSAFPREFPAWRAGIDRG